MEEKKKTSAKNTKTKSTKKDTRGKTSLIILMVLILVIIVFVVNTVRKLNIISDLNAKYAEYENITNYYEKAVPVDEDSELISMEVYRTEDAIKNVTVSKSGSMIQITSKNGGRKEFYNSSSGKTMRYSSNTDLTPAVQLLNYTMEQNFWSAMFLKVSSSDVDGKSCYVISNVIKPKYSDGKFKIYIDKVTGLVLQTDNMKYEYSFNTVTSDDLKGPDDISEYKVVDTSSAANQENNNTSENTENTNSVEETNENEEQE